MGLDGPDNNFSSLFQSKFFSLVVQKLLKELVAQSLPDQLAFFCQPDRFLQIPGQHLDARSSLPGAAYVVDIFLHRGRGFQLILDAV